MISNPELQTYFTDPDQFGFELNDNVVATPVKVLLFHHLNNLSQEIASYVKHRNTDETLPKFNPIEWNTSEQKLFISQIAKILIDWINCYLKAIKKDEGSNTFFHKQINISIDEKYAEDLLGENGLQSYQYLLDTLSFYYSLISMKPNDIVTLHFGFDAICLACQSTPKGEPGKHCTKTKSGIDITQDTHVYEILKQMVSRTNIDWEFDVKQIIVNENNHTIQIPASLLMTETFLRKYRAYYNHYITHPGNQALENDVWWEFSDMQFGKQSIAN